MKKIFQAQKRLFERGLTQGYRFRKEKLLLLKTAIINNKQHLINALHQDLNKSETEAILTEIGPVLQEINFYLKHLKKWMQPQPVKTPFILKPGKSYRWFAPLGLNLIISPWNYPVNLTFIPLAAAVAAGNTAIVKVSSYSRHTGQIIAKIISEAFSSDHVAGFTGPRTEADYLLNMEFDHIFFTGSAAVAKIISEKAARHLSRVTLELGGKSPVVIDDTVNLKIAARRIVFGKLINAGQTCIAPDYLICKSEIRDEVIKELVTALKEAYPAGFLDNLDYPKIINEKHYNRLCELIKQQKPLFGGAFRQQKIEPALILADNDSPLLHEEIFGPILPIITYNNEAEIKTIIDRNPFPLAFYLFSKNNKLKKQLLSTIRFGGCSINDTLSHFINNRLPFGGIRLSGQGSYHGFYSFRTFSHEAGIYEKHHKREIKLKYPPYSSKIKKIIRKIFLPKNNKA